MDIVRKPRSFFDEGSHPATVTFDDGKICRRSLPWSHFHSADWDYSDPTAIRVEIGDWQVVISGHNLGLLFEAIAAGRLARVRVRPEFADDPEHQVDVFATSIRFIPSASTPALRGPAAQLRLPI